MEIEIGRLSRKATKQRLHEPFSDRMEALRKKFGGDKGSTTKKAVTIRTGVNPDTGEWVDPKLFKHNPALTLPAGEAEIYVRADGKDPM